MHRLARFRPRVHLSLALAAGSALAACSDGSRERAETSPVTSGSTVMDSVLATTSDPAASQTFNPTPTPSSADGGQSGGAGDGFGNAIEDGPPQPCACMTAASAGTVLSMGDGCVQVQVTGVYNPYDRFEVGDVIGGTLDLACRQSAPVHAGDQVLFQYYPGRTDECPAYRQCVTASCVGIDDACRKACMEQTLGNCTDPAAWSQQTGRFSALLRQGDDVSFHFAGKDRKATVGELTANPQCWVDHFGILNEPGALAAYRQDEERAAPDASYDPEECFEPQEQ
jgi:hypothetical protein